MRKKQIWVATRYACVLGLMMFHQLAIGQSKADQESHQKMKVLLEEKIDGLPWPMNPDKQKIAIQYLERQIANAESFQDSIELFASSVLAYMNIGQNSKAIARLEAFREMVSRPGAPAVPEHFSDYSIRVYQAIAYFRDSELKNCCSASRTSASCIFPFSEEAIHRMGDDPERSRDILISLLEENPIDFRSMWLLNVVNAAIGDSMDVLPETMRIDMDYYASDMAFPAFENIATKMLVETPGLAGGTSVEDYNNDGWLDIVTTGTGLRDEMTVFINSGTGIFVDASAASGLNGITGGLNMTHCDYNNDGWIDIMVLRGGWMEGEAANFPNSLLRNNGDGTFTDVTISTGLLSMNPTHVAIWADFNQDGWQDVFVGNEVWSGTTASVSEFYVNNGDGTFRECAALAGLDIAGFVKGASFLDVNRDGRLDLYVSNADADNLLFLNRSNSKEGIPVFEEIAAEAGVREPVASFSSVAADFNQDGWDDLFVTGYDPPHTNEHLAEEYLGLLEPVNYPRIYINDQKGGFAERSVAFGLKRTVDAMGLAAGDINGDGYPDLYAGTGNPDLSSLYPNLLFLNIDGQRFEDVTTASRTGHLQKGHGVAIADLDHDGDNDIFINMGGFQVSDIGYKACFENPIGGSFLGLKLEGCTSDRQAVGARIEVVVDGKDGPYSIYTTITSGDGFGASPYRKSIGLRGGTQISEVRIYWPSSGEEQVVKGLEPGNYYFVRECEDGAVPLTGTNNKDD